MKCDSIVIPNKLSPPLPSYHLDSSAISHHPVVRYLGVLVDSKLNWNEHCKYVSAKASRSLNFLHHHLYNSPISIKSIAYNCIIQPIDTINKLAGNSASYLKPLFSTLASSTTFAKLIHEIGTKFLSCAQP